MFGLVEALLVREKSGFDNFVESCDWSEENDNFFGVEKRMIHQKLFQPIEAGFFFNNFHGRYVSGNNMLICFKIHNFPYGGSVVTWFNGNFKFINQHGDHQLFFEPLPVFYEPLCSVSLAGWHKARDPGLPKDFLLGFVLALCCCCCSQKNKILSEGALFFKAVFSQDFLQDS